MERPARRAAFMSAMARPVTMITGQWADLPLAELAAKCGAWGFDGLELATWGDHFDVPAALSDAAYVRERRSLLEQHGLGVWAISAHLVGQAVCDPIDARHATILPPEIYGDGSAAGVQQRAAERVADTARAAAALGIRVYTIAMGSDTVARIPVALTRVGVRYGLARTTVDEKLLTDIATTSGGRYYRAKDTDALRRIYGEIDRLERTPVRTRRYVRYSDWYLPFLLAGAALFLLEVLFRATRWGRVP